MVTPFSHLLGKWKSSKGGKCRGLQWPEITVHSQRFFIGFSIFIRSQTQPSIWKPPKDFHFARTFHTFLPSNYRTFFHSHPLLIFKSSFSSHQLMPFHLYIEQHPHQICIKENLYQKNCSQRKCCAKIIKKSKSKNQQWMREKRMK